MNENEKNEIIQAYNKYLCGPQKIYHILKKRFTLKQIKSVLDTISTKQIFTKSNPKDKYIKFSAPSGSYMADLTFYTQYKKFNSGYHILLTIINLNTRKLFVYPLKTKSKNSVYIAFEDFIKNNEICSISFDAGTEFSNNLLTNLFDENKIEVLVFNKSGENHMHHTAPIERANRTIRNLIDKYMINNNTNKFIDKLPELVLAYNNTPHSSLENNQSPDDIKYQDYYENEKDIEKKEISIQKAIEKFKIGDRIRILKNKNLFEKGAQQYSKSIYEITDIVNQNFEVRNISNGIIKNVNPWQMLKINENTKVGDYEKIKKQRKQVKDKNKANRSLKREGIYEEVEKNKKLDKLKKQLQY
jgi:hypothetical protein